MEKWIVWKDRANQIEVPLLDSDGNAYDATAMGNITKVEIRYKGKYYDSVTLSDSFDLTTKAASGILIVKPGLMGWGAGSDIVELILYDAVNTDGIVYSQYAVYVKDDAEKLS